jgi:hypothetical protein
MLLGGVADDFNARQLRATRVVIWLATCQGAALLTHRRLQGCSDVCFAPQPYFSAFPAPCCSPRECSAFVGPFAPRCGCADPNPAQVRLHLLLGSFRTFVLRRDICTLGLDHILTWNAPTSENNLSCGGGGTQHRITTISRHRPA